MGPVIAGQLQQYLPFTVLKHHCWYDVVHAFLVLCCNSTYRLRYWNSMPAATITSLFVATVLTVYGIETPRAIWYFVMFFICCNSTYRLRYWNSLIASPTLKPLTPLQQYLPFTVLKPYYVAFIVADIIVGLQQYLPFTVLKPINSMNINTTLFVATVLTVYGIETCRRVCSSI